MRALVAGKEVRVGRPGVTVSVDGVTAGTIEIADTIKPEAAAAVRRLRDLGLEELVQQGAVVVEWGERLAVDSAALIEIDHLGGDRRLIRTKRDLSH